MSTLPRPLAVAMSGVTLLLLAACAIALGWISLQRNFDRACDRNEWPYFSSCPKPDASVAAQVRDLRQRVARNPGDVTAYLALSLLTAQSGGIAPLDSRGRGKIMALDVPIECAGVQVHHGDLIFGDADGVVVVPQAVEKQVLDLAFEKVKGERSTLQDLRRGDKLADVFARYGIL